MKTKSNVEFTMKLQLKRLYDDEEEEFEYLQNKLYKIKIIQDSMLLLQYDGENIENDNHFYKDLYVDITMGDILFSIEPDSLNTKHIIFHDDDDYASNNNNA